MRRLAACQLLPDGETIDSHLEPKLLQRLSKRLDFDSEIRIILPFADLTFVQQRMHKLSPSARRALDATLANWRGKRPIWLLLLLNSLRSTLATAENSRAPVLDLYLARKAQVSMQKC